MAGNNYGLIEGHVISDCSINSIFPYTKHDRINEWDKNTQAKIADAPRETVTIMYGTNDTL